jgi:HPt (histidine-containing phosphotransfer) domain-containing protein
MLAALTVGSLTRGGAAQNPPLDGAAVTAWRQALSDGVNPTETSPEPVWSAVLDRPALLERYAGHQELLFEIAGLFRAEAPERVTVMEEAMVRGDAGALSAAAHTLRGSAANFMATETVDAALRLELAAGQGDLILAGGVVEELKQSLDRLVHELAKMSDGRESAVARPPGGALS